jgi:hypothetical protein
MLAIDPKIASGPDDIGRTPSPPDGLIDLPPSAVPIVWPASGRVRPSLEVRTPRPSR